MSEPDDPELRRILIAFGAASLPRGLLQMAVELAARLQGEVSGLFVEDEDLLRSAQLPFVRQFSVMSARGAPFGVGTIERELKMLAAQAQRGLAEAAQRARIRHSFRVVRGRVAAALAATAAEADLIVLEVRDRPLGRYLATSRKVAQTLGRPVLLLDAGAVLPRTLIVAFDAQETSVRTLRLIARLAAAAHAELHVLALDGGRASSNAAEKAVAAALAGLTAGLKVKVIPARGVEDICAYVRAAGASLLALSVQSPLLDAAMSRKRIEACDCPLLLVQ